MADRSTSRSETAYLPPSAPPTNHGHTTAAWFTTFSVIAGFVVTALGMILAVSWLFWAGRRDHPLGLVIGKVLQVLGHGQGGDKTREKERRRLEAGRGH